jgi:hypothetical protein
MREKCIESADVASEDVWSELLRRSRLALALLDAETLERLATRADALLAMNSSNGLATAGTAQIQQDYAPSLTREHSLLRALLVESKCNLRVLRRSRDAGRELEEGEAWVR